MCMAAARPNGVPSEVWDVSWPATFDATGGARYSPATIGVMIDESFSRVANAIRPPGRSIVTSELSIDLVNTTGSGDASLNCEAEALAVSVDAALALSSLKDDHGAIIGTATTWCRFIKGGHDESQTYPQAPKPPPDLDLNHLITATSTPEGNTVTAARTVGLSSARASAKSEAEGARFER